MPQEPSLSLYIDWKPVVHLVLYHRNFTLQRPCGFLSHPFENAAPGAENGAAVRLFLALFSMICYTGLAVFVKNMEFCLK